VTNPLATAAVDAGGVHARTSTSARLRDLLTAELGHGERELRQSRSGYGHEVAVAAAPADGALLAVCPVARELRADPAAVTERGWFVVAAAVGALVDATSPGPVRDSADLRLRAGDFAGYLALELPTQRGQEAEAADLAAALYEERTHSVDRLRTVAVPLAAHVLTGVEDLKAPIGPTHPLKVAEAVARLGGDSADEASVEQHEDAVFALLEPPEEVARAHEDPDPVRRMARRILQRLDGAGKWGGYHTEFTHLAKGFARGNEQARAAEVGERLLAAGLLVEKISVGQRHVFLNPRKSGEIKALIADGTVPPQLELPR
jgi:hypothetical protein